MTFYVYRDTKGEWRWYLKSTGNNKKIADSGEGYINKADCLNGIRLVKSAVNASVIEL
jgi:uncharacterized protein YegP (UPF0339 family)